MKKKSTKTIVIILIWLLIWEIGARIINNSIMLSGPVSVAKALFSNLITRSFYLIILHSFAMIFSGFLLALVLGILLAALSYRFELAGDFLLPLMTAVKSVPVASFVVILLIWFGSGTLSVYISFLIVLPNIYVSTLEGLKHCDQNFRNLATISRLSSLDFLKYLYWPAVYPYLISGLKSSIGMAWKSGVAAEVIGMSKNTLGERIYISKVYLETDNLFAWTLMVILLSYAFEKFTLFLVNKLGKHHFSSKGTKVEKNSSLVLSKEKCLDKSCPVFNEVSKAFDSKPLFEGLTIDFINHKRFMLLSPSGSGKTTILKLLTGLEKEDSGSIKRVKTSIAFQDEIFLENYTAMENLRIFAKDTMTYKEIENEALKVLPWDSLCKPVKEFSGGMKRRLSVVRALLSDSELLLLDEPFSGLDEDNKKALASLIEENLSDRYLIYSGHYDEDAGLLKAERVNIWKLE